MYVPPNIAIWNSAFCWHFVLCKILIVVIYTYMFLFPLRASTIAYQEEAVCSVRDRNWVLDIIFIWIPGCKGLNPHFLLLRRKNLSIPFNHSVSLNIKTWLIHVHFQFHTSVIRSRPSKQLTWSMCRADKLPQQLPLFHPLGRSCEMHIGASDPSLFSSLYVKVLVSFICLIIRCPW